MYISISLSISLALFLSLYIYIYIHISIGIMATNRIAIHYLNIEAVCLRHACNLSPY